MPTHTVIVEYDSRPRPLWAVIHNHATDQIEEIPCHAKGTGISYEALEANMARVRELFDGALSGAHTIITNQFKLTLQQFELHTDGEYDVYDIASKEPTARLIKQIKQLRNWKLLPWRKSLANASMVYHEMELVGLLQNEIVKHPIWSPDATTGRSRCQNFNIQGIPKPKPDDPNYVTSVIRTGNTTENDLLMHFDWSAADARVAAHMSQDPVLLDAFLHDDPYNRLVQVLGKSRDECKKMWLVAVNQQDLNSPVFGVFPVLKQWVLAQLQRLQRERQLSTFYGRIFKLQDDSPEERLRVFNSVLQGGTVHLMQAALCRMRQIPQVHLVADLHDGLVLICPDAIEAQKQVLQTAKKIMSQPIPEIDICMVFRVSTCRVGDGWHNWRPLLVCRDGKKIESLRPKPEPEPENETMTWLRSLKPALPANVVPPWETQPCRTGD